LAGHALEAAGDIDVRDVAKLNKAKVKHDKIICANLLAHLIHSERGKCHVMGILTSKAESLP